MKIAGKVAIVTGAAKRVGSSIALALAREGADVVVHYRRSKKEALKTVGAISALGVRAFPVKADLSVVAQSLKLAQEAYREFGRIDILVNCASVYEKTPLGKISEKEWDRHLDTNLKGAFFLSQAVSRFMLKQKSGKIVNIIDSDVARPYPHYLPYLVSKAGLAGLTQILAKELAPHIQVNGISPGPVLMQPHWGKEVLRAIIKATPLKKIGSPEDIAHAVLFAVEGTDFMTGAVIPVDGGQHIL